MKDKRLSVLWLLIVAVLCPAFFACSSGGGSDENQDSSSESQVGNTNVGRVSIAANPKITDETSRSFIGFSAELDSSGIFQVNFSISNTTSLQLVSQVENRLIATNRLIDPNGNIIVSREDALAKTLAVFPDTFVNSLPYPTQGSDTKLVDGTYFQELEVADGASASRLSGMLAVKHDPNPSMGHLRVNLFLVGEEATRDRFRSILEEAFLLWQQIFSAIGISLEKKLFILPINHGILPLPSIGSEFYLEEITKDGVLAEALNVFIGNQISADGTMNSLNTISALGYAPAIPGPVVPTLKSVIAISLDAHTGPDGLMSEEEINLLAETLGHESAHYLGLFHPVERGSRKSSDILFIEGDALSDTPACNNLNDCHTLGLTSNIMFPFPINGLKQRSFTYDQSQVINLQVLID